MGVVNVTPDSFYAGSRYPRPDRAVDAALQMVDEGASLIDLGAESTRPGSTGVSLEEELARLLPILERLRPRTSTLISVDTRKSIVAERALAVGADIVNDISGLSADENMAQVVAAAGAGVVIMHMVGTPATMQRQAVYDDVVKDVEKALAKGSERAISAGIARESILVDPGIGFGKTIEHNLVLLNRLSELSQLGLPILVGTSRKNFIGRILTAPPEGCIFGTAASVAVSVMGGAHIVRVHDVREMREVAQVTDAIRHVKGGSE
jgi:dihydropteroate synthase